MSIKSVIQIIKVNELRTGSKDGRPWAMQDAECLLLDENGEASQVGVLMLPRDMRGDAAPAKGVYLGSFALVAGLRDRRIEAQLTGLVPYDIRRNKPAADAPASPPARA